eukprot:2743075-Rhodomonas_salina.2
MLRGAGNDHQQRLDPKGGCSLSCLPTGKGWLVSKLGAALKEFLGALLPVPLHFFLLAAVCNDAVGTARRHGFVAAESLTLCLRTLHR